MGWMEWGHGGSQKEVGGVGMPYNFLLGILWSSRYFKITRWNKEKSWWVYELRQLLSSATKTSLWDGHDWDDSTVMDRSWGGWGAGFFDGNTSSWKKGLWYNNHVHFAKTEFFKLFTLQFHQYDAWVKTRQDLRVKKGNPENEILVILRWNLGFKLFYPSYPKNALWCWYIYLHHFWGKCRCAYSSTMEHLG